MLSVQKTSSELYVRNVTQAASTSAKHQLEEPEVEDYPSGARTIPTSGNCRDNLLSRSQNTGLFFFLIQMHKSDYSSLWCAVDILETGLASSQN